MLTRMKTKNHVFFQIIIQIKHDLSYHYGIHLFICVTCFFPVKQHPTLGGQPGNSEVTGAVEAESS